MTPAVSFAIGLSLVLGICSLSSADIYRYQDKDGVWHFTNIKKDTRYKLFLRTYKKKPSQYIKEYEGIIKQATRRFEVDPSLIKAVIRAESDFDDRAISNKGAQGLMQLMPETADAMEVANPFNPEENIYGGTRYLSQLLERFKSDINLALAAYNAGPEAVEAHGGVPPFPETKSFVAKVLDYYKHYKSGTK
ncbi:MAG: lytic transglycosylase domain-containing protein [Deltaproteobacteria bacterium]|nr:MAG: lytic transglycosylase domain-containing protein [Deltaproteobacteria bacterium]